MMTKKILIIFLVFVTCFAYPQSDTIGMIRYSRDFKFNDGIFVTFDQVRNNSPIPKSRIISDYNITMPNFFEKALKGESVKIYDSRGYLKEFPTKEIWGFAQNGILFIQYNDGFSRVPIIGGICHFVSMKTYTTTRTYDPYYYNSYTTYYDPMRNTTQTSTEMIQYIFEFRTGKVMEYNNQSLKIALMSDPEIYEEFNNLRKRKQKKMLFQYLRQFNQRNPIYFPKTKK